MITKLIMYLCRVQYRRQKGEILYIKGKEKDFPRYLLYTENEDVYHRMNRF